MGQRFSLGLFAPKCSEDIARQGPEVVDHSTQKYVCPEAPPPPGRYPPGKSAHDFIDLFHWCRSIDGGPACSCNQYTGLPECGCDGPNRGMSFDFDLITAAYPCLNCLCVDMRQPGLHRGFTWNTFRLGAEHQLGMLPTEGGAPSTNEDITQAQEQGVSGHGQSDGPSHGAHSYENIHAPGLHAHGGTRGIIITTGTTGPHTQLSRLPTVTTGLGNINSLSTVGHHVPANAHRLKGSLPRSNAVKSSPGAGPSDPGFSIPPHGYAQSVMNPPMGAHSHELLPVGFRTGVHTIVRAQSRVIHIMRRPVRQKNGAASPAAGSANMLPVWGAKAHRTTRIFPPVELPRAQPVQSSDTLSRANPHQITSDDELDNMHRVQISGRPTNSRYKPYGKLDMY